MAKTIYWDFTKLCGTKKTNTIGGDTGTKHHDNHVTEKCKFCCCCNECEPTVLGKKTTNGYSAPTWDLTPFQGPGKGPAHAYWRLIELGVCFPGEYPWYGTGCVNVAGTLVGLPAVFTTIYYYNGYMELQIGCIDPYDSNFIIWPGLCQNRTPVGDWPAPC